MFIQHDGSKGKGRKVIDSMWTVNKKNRVRQVCELDYLEHLFLPTFCIGARCKLKVFGSTYKWMKK